MYLLFFLPYLHLSLYLFRIESFGKEIPEHTMSAALRLAQCSIQPIIDKQKEYITSLKAIKEEAAAAAAAATSTSSSLSLSPSLEAVIVKPNDLFSVPDALATFVREGLTKEVEAIYHNSALSLANRSRAEGILRSTWTKALAAHEEFGQQKV